MDDRTIQCAYFGRSGTVNTERVLEIAKAQAEALGIRSILVATTSGETGVRASRVFVGYNLVLVTHAAGFRQPND